MLLGGAYKNGPSPSKYEVHIFGEIQSKVERVNAGQNYFCSCNFFVDISGNNQLHWYYVMINLYRLTGEAI